MQSADSLALYTQAAIPGAFILGKARGGPDVVEDCLGHLTRYVELLFTVRSEGQVWYKEPAAMVTRASNEIWPQVRLEGDS